MCKVFFLSLEKKNQEELELEPLCVENEIPLSKKLNFSIYRIAVFWAGIYFFTYFGNFLNLAKIKITKFKFFSVDFVDRHIFFVANIFSNFFLKSVRMIKYTHTVLRKQMCI